MTRTTEEISLPAELWIEIFNKINSFQQLVQCSMVNPKWQQFAMTVLSNKKIAIDTHEAAKVVYNCLESNIVIKRSIKHLVLLSPQEYTKRLRLLSFPDPPKIDYLQVFKELVPLVVAQNLETLEGTTESSAFFQYLLKQSYDEEWMARFSNLKSIPSAWSYNAAYDRLLYRLRDTLSQVTLNFRKRFKYQDKSGLATLYHLNNLYQLEDLTLNSNAHTVQDIEHILKNCLILKCLTIYLSHRELFKNMKHVGKWIKNHTVQIKTLTTLKIRLDYDDNLQFLDYLLHKCPNIQDIALVCKLEFRKPWMLTAVPQPMDMDTIRTILGKIQAVTTFTLTCSVSQERIDDIIRVLTSDGYLSFKGPRGIYLPTIVVTNNKPDHVLNPDITYNETDTPYLLHYH